MNCIIIDDDELSIKILEKELKKIDFVNVIQKFDSALKALPYLISNKTELVFLDIEMPDLNGMDFLKSISTIDSQFILVSGHKEFALEAFEYNVIDYLIKPFDFSRLVKAVTKANKNINGNKAQKNGSEIFFVKKGSGIQRLNKSEILWVEAMGDYAMLYTTSEKYMIHSTMKLIEEKLSTKDYIRVHRSYIVRIDKIDSIEDDAITLNEKLIPIGKTYRSEVIDKLNFLF